MSYSEGRVKTTIEAFPKSNELFTTKLKKDVKPRLIFNPPDVAKATTSYINHNLIRWSRQNPEFIVAYNTGDLCDHLYNRYNELKDPVVLTWDGSRFDAH